MFIIGIVGLDRCGKDTFAKMLVKEFKKHKKEVAIRSFADKLKDVTADIMKVDRHLLEKMKNDNILVSNGIEIMTTRDYIIRVADSIRKNLGEDVFIDALKKELNKIENIDIVILPDTRFVLEAEMIKQMNGLVVRLHSDTSNCGKNGKRYEVDKIKPDVNVKNKKGQLTVMEDEADRLVKYVIEKKLKNIYD